MQRINPKVFIVSGILLMALSFYMNYYLSFLTEKWYIMLSLYLRGAGYGIALHPVADPVTGEYP